MKARVEHKLIQVLQGQHLNRFTLRRSNSRLSMLLLGGYQAALYHNLLYNDQKKETLIPNFTVLYHFIFHSQRET